jgi:2-oxoglutarate dehydrogenase E2 component (dihydrolipoamide succinyltransferase)
MATEILLPAMGEGIIEATLIQWMKNVGDPVAIDEPIAEVATDKVNSEVNSTVSGIFAKQLYNVNDVIPVGKPFAIVSVDGKVGDIVAVAPVVNTPPAPVVEAPKEDIKGEDIPFVPTLENTNNTNGEDANFFSPLVLNIAKEEGISKAELSAIKGTGTNGRVTKDDLKAYLTNRSSAPIALVNTTSETNILDVKVAPPQGVSAKPTGNVEVVEMDRMRKLIADHMIMSKKTSPHVCSFIEVDMTNVVIWRNKVKNQFKAKYNENLTFMPIITEAVVKAIKDFPMINASVDGSNIIIKKDINIGIAAALPSGNLIVPVIKAADQLNTLGLCKSINDLAGRARTNKLKPDETNGGTYTISNVGSFGTLFAVPIINQPQVAILALGAIVKKPVVLELEDGDVIGIRSMMFMSHAYDHRIIDGALGGMFIQRVKEYLEGFDMKKEI